jgi:hypothetical protein
MLPRVGHFLITEHVEWEIDASARSYFALLYEETAPRGAYKPAKDRKLIASCAV